MEEINLAFLFSSFIAGLLTFLAPCTLPLVPAFLGFISGVDKEELENPETAHKARHTIFLNGLFFIIGFSVIFIGFGTLAGLLGQVLVPFRIWLTRIGGIFIIIFGLFLLGALKLPVFSGNNLKLPKWIKPGKPSSSMAVGATFAFGWTPCVGPILGSILLLASSSATASQGIILLAVFSLGLAIPFLVLSFAFSKATVYIKKITKYLGVISKIGGIFLIGLGILLLFNKFGLLIQWGFELLDFLNYEEALMDFL